MRKKWTACFGTNVVAGCLGLDSPLWIGCSVDGCLAVAFGWTSIWIDPTATSSMTLMKKPAAKPDESNSLALVPVESSKRKGSESEAGSDGSKRARLSEQALQDHNQFAQETERKKLSEAEFLEQFKLLSAKTQQNLWKRIRELSSGPRFRFRGLAGGNEGQPAEETQDASRMDHGQAVDRQVLQGGKDVCSKKGICFDYAANGRPCSPALSPRPRPSKKSGSPRNRPFG